MSWLGEEIKPGSLLKPDFPGKKRKVKPEGHGQRTPREKKPGHLALVRQLPCLGCGWDQGCDAAHLRVSAPGKPITGISRKPDDRWTNPLCHTCHMKQHSMGERDFWKRLKIDPFVMAETLYRLSPDLEAMRQHVLKVINRYTGEVIR